jgi:DNA polymerase-3 subunit epsilon
MTDWRSARFAVVDVETTGLDRGSEVLSIGILDVCHGRVRVGSAYYRELRPSVAPAAENVLIHGIRPVDAAAAADPADVGREVVERLRGRILVAHVAWVERAFLGEWLAPYGWAAPRRVVDTDALARLALAREGGPVLRSHIGLGEAARLHGLPEHRRHHALGDALTTAQLFVALATKHPATVRGLLGAPRRLQREIALRRWRRRPT